MATLSTMLTALYADERLTIGETPEPLLRTRSKDGELRCPNCDRLVTYKHGAIKVAHFAHRGGEACIDRFGEPDGPAHQAMKRVMKAWLAGQILPTFPDARIEMEVRIETEQRADVLATRQ